MPYLSQMLQRTIEDSADNRVGTLKDVLIRLEPGSYAPLAFLLIKSLKSGSDLYVPYEAVENIGQDAITLKHGANKPLSLPPPLEELVFLVRDVLDQQIVDVVGARVVRVNDLRLSLFEDRMCVLGIDVSFKGLLRRLGLKNFDFFNLFKVNLIDWRKAQLVKGSLKLNTLSKDLIRLHPADLANIVEDLSLKQGSRLVRSLDTETAAKVLEEIEPERQRLLVRGLAKEEALRIISRMSPDEIADLLQILPKDEARQFLAQLQQMTHTKVQSLLEYQDDTAGGLMTTDFVQAQADWSVKRTIEEVQRLSPAFRSILYVYVVDGLGIFRGTVSLRRLLIAEHKEAMIAELVKRHSARVALKTEDSIKKIIATMTKYNLFLCAVLDEDHKLIGVVSIDDVMRHLAPEA